MVYLTKGNYGAMNRIFYYVHPNNVLKFQIEYPPYVAKQEVDSVL
jgi:hypothetical protein